MFGKERKEKELNELRRQLRETEAAMSNDRLGGMENADAVAEWLRLRIAELEEA